jgi:hypothetical protein
MQYLITLSLVLWVIIAFVVLWNRKKIAAGPWHDVLNGPPLKGVPVLTEYRNARHGYHGFRVDTYSTRLDQWVEATVWDQEVIAYSEIKATGKKVA